MDLKVVLAQAGKKGRHFMSPFNLEVLVEGMRRVGFDEASIEAAIKRYEQIVASGVPEKEAASLIAEEVQNTLKIVEKLYSGKGAKTRPHRPKTGLGQTSATKQIEACVICAKMESARIEAHERHFYTARRVGWDREMTAHQPGQSITQRAVYFHDIAKHSYYACNDCADRIARAKLIPILIAISVVVLSGFVGIGILHPEHIVLKVVVFVFSMGLSSMIVVPLTGLDKDEITEHERAKAEAARLSREREYNQKHRKHAHFVILSKEQRAKLLATTKPPDFLGQ